MKPRVRMPWAKPVQRRTEYRQLAVVFQLAILLLCALSGGLALAQSDDDQSSWQNFVDSVGAAVYKFAWPTATYQRVNFQGVSTMPDGVNLKFRVHGISAFDNGPLWTDVILQVRNGKVDDIMWGENNAVLAKPGETMKALGSLLVELNKQYGQDHPAPTPSQPAVAPDPAPEPPLAAVCLSNPTDQSITYTLRIEGRNENHTLEPGKAYVSWDHVTPPEFSVSFDDSFEEGYTDRTMRLPATVVTDTPSSCSDEMTYEFVLDGRKIGLAPRKWLPGFEHPFLPNVVRAQEEGKWACVPGQTWASSDPNSLECVPATQ